MSWLRGVEEVQPEVDERADPRLAVDEHVALVEVPAARPHDDRRAADVGRAARSALPSGEVNASVPRAASRRFRRWPTTLAQRRGRGVLEVGEPDPRAGVQRVDRHLRGRCRAGDLDPAVDEGRAAAGGTCQSASRISRVSARKSSRSAARDPLAALDAARRAARRAADRSDDAVPRRRRAPRR